MTAINNTQPIIKTPQSIAFRWAYVILPLAVLVVAVIIAAIFYGKLPQDVAYRFSGGIAVNWLSRGSFLGWTLGLQLVFILISITLTFLITGVAQRMRLGDSQVNRTLVSIIGNIVALPQIIILYAMLDVFLYNVYEIALPALWAFALVVLFAGGVILAVFLTRALVQSRRLKTGNASGSESDVRE